MRCSFPLFFLALIKRGSFALKLKNGSSTISLQAACELETIFEL